MKPKIETKDIERRTFSYEVRAGESEESRTVTGYAAVFSSPSELMWGFTEEIAPGAFDSVLDDDVRALFNHDPNQILARTKAGNLSISVDERGLKYEFDAPNTTAGNDLLINLRNGNVSQSSFGFTVESDEWTSNGDGTEKRTITKVGRLFDVSPVTYPAYDTTEVTARSLQAAKAGKSSTENPKELRTGQIRVESRVFEIYDLVDAISAKFREQNGWPFYISMILIDGTLILKNWETMMLFRAEWSVGEGDEIIISERDDWQEVEMVFVEKNNSKALYQSTKKPKQEKRKKQTENPASDPDLIPGIDRWRKKTKLLKLRG